MGLQVNIGHKGPMGQVTTGAKCYAEPGSPSHRNDMVSKIRGWRVERTLIYMLCKAEYKPVLKEVEKILAEAGLDEEEMRKSAAAGPANNAGQSRNRR